MCDGTKFLRSVRDVGRAHSNTCECRWERRLEVRKYRGRRWEARLWRSFAESRFMAPAEHQCFAVVASMHALDDRDKEQ